MEVGFVVGTGEGTGEGAGAETEVETGTGVETGDHGSFPGIRYSGRPAFLERGVPYRTWGNGCDVYEESVKFRFFVPADVTHNVWTQSPTAV